ncbi:MAG: tyrosine-protein phosphatase [Kiritimatiellae bacterium]|nr:tyrosine-protein phosphatase [Kiritimatiellia bacterium]
MIRSVRYGVALSTTILAFAFGAFGAPMIVSPADYAEIKTVSDRIWEDINSDTYLKQSTYYEGTHTNSFRVNAMVDVSTNSIPIKLQWVGSKGVSTVKLYRTRDLEKNASAEPLYTAQTEGNAITYFDPEVGRNYTWTVTDSTGASVTGHFYTMQRTPRVIYADQNPFASGGEASVGRDIGGWLTSDGTKRVQQGLLYRSAQLEFCSARDGEEIYSPITHLQDNLKIRLDVDLRQGVDHLVKYGFTATNGWQGAWTGWRCEWNNYGYLTIDESSIGPKVRRYCVDFYAPGQFPSYSALFSQDKYKASFWMGFYELYKSIKKGESALFHCSHGKDRTGALAYIILGSLGVAEEDCRRDFGFTWYSDAKSDVFMNASGQSDVMGYLGLTNIKNTLLNTYGSNFKEACVAYLKECCAKAVASGKYSGSSDSAAVIADFQSIMLEDIETKSVAAKVTKPTGNSFTYTGGELVGVPEDARYTISGVSKATDIGSYTATLALKSGYTWEDGTTANAQVTWSITEVVASAGISKNAISDAGYTVTGLGKNSDEVAVVITNFFASYTWKAPKDLKYVKYLVVGGGGGGGGRAAYATSEYEGGAGGGGGGVVAGSIFSLKAGDVVSFNVGAGGDGGKKSTSYSTGTNGKGAGAAGSNSSLKVNGVDYVTAFGGSGDAGHGVVAGEGGSNAGNRGKVTAAQSYTAAGSIGSSATSLLSYTMYGNKGGVGLQDTYSAAAGGGGATEVGGNARKIGDGVYAAGNGGLGVVSDITGTRTVYGSGGGGGATSKTEVCYAGSGGNGAGDGAIDGVGEDALANQGGGGGGGALSDDSDKDAKGGKGGSGIVVLRYSINAQPEAETPVIVTDNKVIITYGDSVTRGSKANEVTMDDRKTYFGGRLKGVANVPESYPYWLSGFLSDNYNVINQSRGSTLASHVSSWFGVQEVSVNATFTLPKSGSVTLNKKLVFNNCTYGNSMDALPADSDLKGFITPVYPLSENYTAGTTSDSIVGTLGGYRVRIQGDDVASLKVTALDSLAADVTIPAGSVFIPESATVDEYKNAIKVVCMGGNDWIGNRNGDYGEDDPYSYTYKNHIRPLAMKLKSEGGRYLVVSPLFNPDGSSPGGDVESPEPSATEKLYAADFGENYLNLRLAFVQNAERLAKELDIKINGEWYDFGGSIIASDYVHLTSAGYKIKAALIREKLVSLGYITEVVKPVYTTEFAYDGSVKQCVPNGSGYVISGVNEASETGEYKVLVTPEPGRVWTDGTSDPIQITWSIAQLSAGGESFVLKVDTADGKLLSNLGEGENEYAAIFTTADKEITWEVPTDLVNVQFLVVGGGGGGGAISSTQGGAGGGGGGVVTGIVNSLSRGQKIKLFVGKGGAGGTTTTETTVSSRVGVDPDGDGTEYGVGGAYSGQDSYFAVDSVEYARAYGGAGDPGAGLNAKLGGSNSGGRTTTAQGTPKKGVIGASAIDNISNYKIFGNKGGVILSTTPKAAAGGGGATTVGENAKKTSSYQIGGGGGEGVVSTITGSEIVYGSGGAGGLRGNIVEDNMAGYGGSGGTGAGAGSGESAKANQGGGGGGGSTYPKSATTGSDPLDWKPDAIIGGNGGSGIVVLRFSIPGADEKLKVAEVTALIKNYVYDGTEHTCGLSSTDVRYTLSGVTKATEVGTYTVTVTVKDGWIWNDNNSEPSRTFTWKITQATNEWVTEPSISKTAWDAGATVSYSLGSAKSGVPVVVTIKKDSAAFSGTLATMKDWQPGFYSITFSVAATSGYTGLTKTLTVNVTDPNEEIGEVTIDNKWGYITKPAENEYILVFTNHTATAMQWTAPAALQNVQFLVVGGGGGGGADGRSTVTGAGGTGGAGGGGGGVVTGLVNFAKGSVISVAVGKGGSGGKKGVITRNITFVGNDEKTHTAYGDSGKAGDSSFSVGGNVYVKAYAGGGDLGAEKNTDSISNCPEDGGSGSGARWKYRYKDNTTQSKATKGYVLDDTSLIPYYKAFGNPGGLNTYNYVAGGGGGATAKGGDTYYKTVTTTNCGQQEERYAGAGGEGLKSSITGTAVVYGSGGGGGSGVSKGRTDKTSQDIYLGKGPGAKGGTGAGNGNETVEGAGTNAKANQGGGGGGGGYMNNGGSGGSGIVVFRFTVDSNQTQEPEEELIAVAKPVVTETLFTYDGSAKSVVASNASYTLVGNATATEAGNYTVTIKLNAGYVWSDNSTDDIVINWTIVAVEEPFEPGVVQLGGNYGYVVPNVGGNANEYAVVFTNENAGAISWRAPADLENVEFLVVGGGGGGGGVTSANLGGAGGGGGGVITGKIFSVSQGATLTINVGKGGAGGNTAKATSAGESGSASSIANNGLVYVSAPGGGGDSGMDNESADRVGKQGGSNAGARTTSVASHTFSSFVTNGTYVVAKSYGNKGGKTYSTNAAASGGGGGATAAGGNSTSNTAGGKGGEGLASSITGSRVVYGSGGGGGNTKVSGDDYVNGVGGTGAGDGGKHSAGLYNAKSGLANQGGGGGGGGGRNVDGGAQYRGKGGNGGSGIVVLRFSMPVVAETVKVAKPVATTSFTYDGAEKVALASGEGYELSGTTQAVDAGSYTATATLKSGYAWSDDTTEAITFNWSIAKATNAWNTKPAITKTSWYTDEDAATLTLGAAKFGEVVTSMTKDGEAVTFSEILPTEFGNYTITFAVADSNNYSALTETITFTVIQASPVKVNGEYGYVVPGLGANGNEYAVVFTNAASTITWTAPKDLKNVQFLVVGGGGGGGAINNSSDTRTTGAGGGGGGVVTGIVATLEKDASITINVGKGGTAGKCAVNQYGGYGASENGGNSSLVYADKLTVTAYGGGGDGGAQDMTDVSTKANAGKAGGSSGGSRPGCATKTDPLSTEDCVISNVDGLVVYSEVFGQAGGAGNMSNIYGFYWIAGGGGGATEAGGDGNAADDWHGGKGGEGLASSITGELKVYGSGGGGGSSVNNDGCGGVAGTGAGAGNSIAAGSGYDALANQGGGGGGSGYSANGNGGNGGSGIVVLRFSLEEEGETPEVPPTPASDWSEIPSLSKKIFNAGTAITVFNGASENRTITANYTAAQIAALNPGTYTFRATASAAGVEPLVYEIDFWVLPADFSAVNTIVCYGDSITYGDGAAEITIDNRSNYFDGRLSGKTIKANYQYYLAGMIDTKYNVIGQGKSQQWSDTILAWVGGVDTVSRFDATLPAGGVGVWTPTNIVFTADNPYGINGGLQYVRDLQYPHMLNGKYNNDGQLNYFAGLQAPEYPAFETYPEPSGVYGSMTGWFGDKRVRIHGTEEGHPYFSRKNTGGYGTDQVWERVSVEGGETVIPAGTPFKPDTALVYNDAISVIFTGTNDEMGQPYWPASNPKDYTTYISMISGTVAKIPSGRYVVVSTVSGSHRSDEIESAFAKEFGEHHLNLYKLMELYGLKTAVKLDIMTQAEADATTWNTKSTGLMGDSVHPNEKGYQVIAYFLKQKLIELNYIEGERDTDINFDYVAKPTVDVTSFTYDGTEKVVVAEGENYTVTGTAKATNAGSYTATITPNEGFSWADGTIGAVTVNWTIAKATNEWTTEPSITLTEWTVGDAAGVLTAGVAKFGQVAVTINGEAFTQMPTTAGTYEVTYTVADSTNYTALTKTIAFTIKAAPVEPDPDEPGTGGDEEEPKLEIKPEWGYIKTGLGELCDQTIVVFTNENAIATWKAPANLTDVQFIVVGGGGGGGGAVNGGTYDTQQGGAGGGGGAVVTGYIKSLSIGDTLSVIVGKGGEGGTGGTSTTDTTGKATNGGNTSFSVGGVDYITAFGGGGAGGYNTSAVANGGSNSGGTKNSADTALLSVTYIGSGAVDNVYATELMRNKGGVSYTSSSGYSCGGGGGGATSAGVVAKGSTAGGKGGAGFISFITDVNLVYGAGGGGGIGRDSGSSAVSEADPSAGYGIAKAPGTSAKPNQGAGGGGGSLGNNGGNGGSGIVVLRFKYFEGVITVDPEKDILPKISSKAYTGSELTSGLVNTYAYTVEELVVDLINPGKKTVKVTIGDGYVWSDGDQNKSKVFDWYIAEVETSAWGYTVTGLGRNGNEVAVVFTNHTSAINWTAPAKLENVEFLVVGGGGGGGADTYTNDAYSGGGGGGGGGVVTGLVSFAKNASVTVSVGAGGAGGTGATKYGTLYGASAPGGNSVFSTDAGQIVTAFGGGGSGGLEKVADYTTVKAGSAGGSTAGGRSSNGKAGAVTAATQGSAEGVIHYVPMGHNGGSSTGNYAGGGGGGAMGMGDSTSGDPANGGPGFESFITGSRAVYGSGGGGAVITATGGKGGEGAGDGNATATSNGGSGLPNQGGGGGGAGRTDKGTKYKGGNGGSGIVVFRYVIPSVLPQVDGVEVEPGDVLKTARVSKPIWYPAEAEITVKDGVTTITYEGSIVEVPEYYTVSSAPADEGGYTVTLTLNDLATPRIANKVADGEVETPAISIEGDKVKIHLEGTYSTLYYTLETSEKIGEGESWTKAEGDWSEDKSGFTFTITDGEKTPSRFFRVGEASDE